MSTVNHANAFRNRVVAAGTYHRPVFEVIRDLVEELGLTPTAEQSQLQNPSPRKFTFLAGGDGKRWLAVMFPAETMPWFEHLGEGHLTPKSGLDISVLPKKNSSAVWTQVRIEAPLTPEELAQLKEELRAAHDAVRDEPLPPRRGRSSNNLC